MEDVVALYVWVSLKDESLEELKAEEAHESIDTYSYDTAPRSSVSVAATEVEDYWSSKYVQGCNTSF